MNLLEHGNLRKDIFDNIYYGNVVDRDDPKILGRVKVRVFGVFNDPIKAEHIPWALPLASETDLPKIGEYVAVSFLDGDFMRPIYFQ